MLISTKKKQHSNWYKNHIFSGIMSEYMQNILFANILPKCYKCTYVCMQKPRSFEPCRSSTTYTINTTNASCRHQIKISLQKHYISNIMSHAASIHDDVKAWKRFQHYWPFVRWFYFRWTTLKLIHPDPSNAELSCYHYSWLEQAPEEKKQFICRLFQTSCGSRETSGKRLVPGYMIKYQHIEAETNCPPFSTQQFQIDFAAFVFKFPINQKQQWLAKYRRLSIISTNDGPVCWRIHASLGRNEWNPLAVHQQTGSLSWLITHHHPLRHQWPM